MRSHARSRLGIARPGARSRLAALVALLGSEPTAGRLPAAVWRFKTEVDAFVTILDDLAETHGADVWIEKSPTHFAYIDTISRYIPDARFVHLVRPGTDVIASMQAVAGDQPDDPSWARYASIDFCVDIWRNAMEVAQTHITDERHLIVSYRRLVAEPERELGAIARFIGLHFDRLMLEGRSRIVEDLVKGGETWKSGVAGAVAAADDRFTRLFDGPTRDYIRGRIAGGCLVRGVDPVRPPPLSSARSN